MYGMKITIIWETDCHPLFTTAATTYHNVTEVHFNYHDVPRHERARIRPPRIAIESNHHLTGCTELIRHVRSFEIVPESELAPEWVEEHSEVPVL